MTAPSTTGADRYGLRSRRRNKDTKESDESQDLRVKEVSKRSATSVEEEDKQQQQEEKVKKQEEEEEKDEEQEEEKEEPTGELESDSKVATENEAGGEKSSSGRFDLLIMFFVLVILLGFIAGFGYFIFYSFNDMGSGSYKISPRIWTSQVRTLTEKLSGRKCDERVEKLPMFGSGSFKEHLSTRCEYQKKADEAFLAKALSNRKTTPEKLIQQKVEYAQKILATKNDYDAAIRRCNQAWLLDANHPYVSWCFANAIRSQIYKEESQYSNDIFDILIAGYGAKKRTLYYVTTAFYEDALEKLHATKNRSAFQLEKILELEIGKFFAQFALEFKNLAPDHRRSHGRRGRMAKEVNLGKTSTTDVATSTEYAQRAWKLLKKIVKEQRERTDETPGKGLTVVQELEARIYYGVAKLMTGGSVKNGKELMDTLVNEAREKLTEQSQLENLKPSFKKLHEAIGQARRQSKTSKKTKNKKKLTV